MLRLDKSLLTSCILFSLIAHAAGILYLHHAEIKPVRRLAPLFENRKASLAKSSSSSQSPTAYTQELQTVLQHLVLQSRQGKFLKVKQGSEAFENPSFTPSPLSSSKPLSARNKEEENFAQSPFASLQEGRGLSKSQASQGELVRGDIQSTALNEFDTTFKKLQLGQRDAKLPREVRNPSMQKQGKHQRKKQKAANPFNLAVPSEKENLSRQVKYNQAPLVKEVRGSQTSLEGIKRSEGVRGVASQDDFSVQLHYSPKTSGSGYLFEVKLLPKPDATFKRLQQNLYFLIDRSSSITPKKFQAYKDAVASSLGSLHPQDRFNILFFDQSVQRLSPTLLDNTPEHRQKALGFLQQQQNGALFASTNLFHSLEKLLPHSPSEKEVHLALLLTDGNSQQEITKQRKALYQWTEKNNRKISLFTFTCGQKNKLPQLELLSTFNKGRLHYVEKPQDLADSLQHFVQSRQSPLGKDMIAHVLSQNPKTRISLHPKGKRLPDLYENTPYTLYGEVNQEDDFVVVLQGKHLDKWINIKQSISFKEGQKNPQQVNNNWIYHQALDYYEKYLKEGIISDLKQANTLLNTLKSGT